jgi:predicted metal-binding protein
MITVQATVESKAGMRCEKCRKVFDAETVHLTYFYRCTECGGGLSEMKIHTLKPKKIKTILKQTNV